MYMKQIKPKLRISKEAGDLEMSEFIEFDEGQPAPEAEPKPEDKPEEKPSEVDARLARLERAVGKIVKAVEKLQEESEPAPEPAPAPKPAPAPAPAEGEDKEAEEVKEALKKMTAEYQKLTKKVYELEHAPARLTQNVDVGEDADKRIEQFLEKVTGAEMLVWAESRDVAWGKRKRGDRLSVEDLPIINR